VKSVRTGTCYKWACSWHRSNESFCWDHRQGNYLLAAVLYVIVYYFISITSTLIRSVAYL